MNPENSITELLSRFVKDIFTGISRVKLRAVVAFKPNGLPCVAQANIHVSIIVLQRPGMCRAIAGTGRIPKLEERWNRFTTIKGFFDANLTAYSRHEEGNTQNLYKTIHCYIAPCKLVSYKLLGS